MEGERGARSAQERLQGREAGRKARKEGGRLREAQRSVSEARQGLAGRLHDLN